VTIYTPETLPVCCRYPLVVGCIFKTGDGVALFFGAYARVHTMHIVESGHLRGLAESVPTTEAVCVDDCLQRLLTHSLEDRLIPNAVCSLDAKQVGITTCCKRVEPGSHRVVSDHDSLPYSRIERQVD